MLQPGTLFLTNSLTRRKEAFVPIDPGHVRMYVCGPTVYDYAHIGNARPVVVFDVLARLLRRLYPRVTYVRNVTDVDDKINAAAKANGEPIGALTSRTYRAFVEDMAALGALPPDIEPRVTETIGPIIALIERLIANGHAYVADGHVLFSVPSKPDYGLLSRRSRDEMIAGARVDVAPYKLDPADFVLWKPSTPDLPGWDSPWGRGRPGWHIECSAMSWRHLGPEFDIHGGGVDLTFPHHENEIAQSTGAFLGTSFARYWVHNGPLLADGRKMAKSLGNATPVHKILRGTPGKVVRLALLKTHYRQPLSWTSATLAQARGDLERFRRAIEIAGLEHGQNQAPAGEMCPCPQAVGFISALLNDINTPLALVRMHWLADRARQGDKEAASALQWAGQLLAIW